MDFDEIFEATKVRAPWSCEARVVLVILIRSVQPHSPQCSALVPACADVQRLLVGPAVRVKSRSVCVCVRERETVCVGEEMTPLHFIQQTFFNLLMCPRHSNSC